MTDDYDNVTEECFTSTKINPILFEHSLKDCF